jgi:hypothetical protein
MALGSVRSSRLLAVAAAVAAVAFFCFLCMFAHQAGAAEPPLYRYSFGPNGTEATDFNKVGSIAVDQGSGAVYVIDRAAGALYKFDENGGPVSFSATIPYITGLSFFQDPNESQVAVDSTSHIIYVTSSNSVLAFKPDGDPANFTAGPNPGTNQITGFSVLVGVAVDVNGNIYASDYSGHIRIYEPTGEYVTQIDTSTPANLAVAPDGSVYVSRYAGSVLKFTPSEFPITTSTLYTPSAEPLDQNVSQTVAVDPATGNVYVSEFLPSSFSFTRVLVYDASGALLTSFGGPGEEGELAGTSPGLGIMGSTGRIFVGTDDENSARSKVEVFAPEEIVEGPPSVLRTSASDVTAASALLRAVINPNTAETTYRFEYGTSDCAATPGSCSVQPAGGTSLAPGHKPVAVDQAISGLQPGTTYYYRVVADNVFGTTAGMVRTFTTQAAGLGFDLSDSRIWEMVSPPNKFGGMIVSAESGTMQAAEDGNGLVYQSLGTIEGEPEGNRAIERASVLARRDATGWVSKDITPPHSRATQIAAGTEYDLFSPDLWRAVLEPRDATPLSSASSERTPYLRQNSEPPVYTPLVTSKEGFANVPPGTKFGGDELHGQVSEVTVAGASRDLEHIVLASKVPLVAGGPAESGGGALYEWDTGKLHPVSVLPNIEDGTFVRGILGSGQGSVRNAISSDGSRVFWGPGTYGAGGINLTGLYVRDTIAEETTRLDQVEPDASGEGAPHPAFQSASFDGTVVFFTDSQQLTEDASPTGRDLYRCVIPAGTESQGCASLEAISAPLPGSGESAEVKGLVAATSEDGGKAYFVANGKLNPAPNPEGETAIQGEPNLYFWHQGGGVRFVATLSEDDSPAWGQVIGDPDGPPGYVRLLNSASSPDGRHFAFMSERGLAGAEDQDAGSGEEVAQVFRYDSGRDELACVSCDPTGAGPKGQVDPPEAVDVQRLWEGQTVSSTLPESTTSAGEQLTRYPVYRPRAVLDNGRIFFNAFGGLVPADSNGNWDVYQYEPLGVGSCAASSDDATIASSGAGCVSLISSGTAERESSFLDSSSSGDDVFFLTAGKLSPIDKDTVTDVYDARVGGIAAALHPASGCVGDTCRPTLSPPASPPVAAETFRGPGNVRHCPKGKRKVRRQGKLTCVRRKHHRPKHHGHHRHSSGNGGTR